MYICPAGLVGLPANETDYEVVNLNQVFTLYIEREVLRSYIKEHHLSFYIEGYGRFELELWDG